MKNSWIATVFCASYSGYGLRHLGATERYEVLRKFFGLRRHDVMLTQD